MKPLNIVLAATAAAAAVAAFPLVSSQARMTGNLAIAQMMNDDKGPMQGLYDARTVGNARRMMDGMEAMPRQGMQGPR